MLEIYPTFLWLKTFIFLLPSPLSHYLSIYLFSYIAKGKVNLQLNRVS